MNLPAANYCSVALHNPRARSWQVLFIKNSFLSEREAFAPWVSVTVGFRLFWHALRPPPCLSATSRLDQHWQTSSGGTSSSHGPFFQPQSGVSADAGNGLRGVMGTRRRGSRAAQSWVKPTEAAGAEEEAHRRWHGGRSEHGRELGKG